MSNPTAPVNQELAALFQEDQQDRRSPVLREGYRERDRARRQRVAQIVAEGGLTSGHDYGMAALIFQHGETPAEYLQAYHLACKAIDLGVAEMAWFAAVAMDRHLVRQGLPSKYGTQFVRMGGIYRAPRLDPATTDQERAALGIPSRADLLAQRNGPGMPPVTNLGSLAVDGLRVTVWSLPRPLTWHSEMLPDREATGLTAPSGRPVWTNRQGWHWAEQETGEFDLGWTRIPYAPELGHTVARAERAKLAETAAGGRPAIWVNTGAQEWTLYAVDATGEGVWAVTGVRRDDVVLQMERLLLSAQ